MKTGRIEHHAIQFTCHSSCLSLSTANLLDEILEEQSPEPSVSDANDLTAFINRAIRPHLETSSDPEQAAQARASAERATLVLWSLLHQAEFQALEAGWRGLRFLIDRLETGGGTEIYLIDVTLEELRSDTAGMRSLLADPASNWSVIVGNYRFGQTESDAKILSSLGSAAQAIGAILLAESEPPTDQAEEVWSTLRSSHEARSIGLSLPGFLMRLPYVTQHLPAPFY